MIEKCEQGLRVSGPMLIADSVALLEAGRAFLRDSEMTGVTIDMSAVEETDSSALSVIFGLLRSARQMGKTMRISSPPASMISLASLYGVSETLPLA